MFAIAAKASISLQYIRRTRILDGTKTWFSIRAVTWSHRPKQKWEQPQGRNLTGLTAVSAVLTICLALNSCTQKENNALSAAGTPASAQPPPQVELTTAKSQKLSTTISLPGELMPYEAIDVYARETGFVKSIKVDRGSSVKPGELIAELAPELLARRAQANAAYQRAQAQLAAGQAKLAADQATYQHMSAASKTPGVVAANDLDIALCRPGQILQQRSGGQMVSGSESNSSGVNQRSQMMGTSAATTKAAAASSPLSSDKTLTPGTIVSIEQLWSSSCSSSWAGRASCPVKSHSADFKQISHPIRRGCRRFASRRRIQPPQSVGSWVAFIGIPR